MAPLRGVAGVADPAKGALPPVGAAQRAASPVGPGARKARARPNAFAFAGNLQASRGREGPVAEKPFVRAQDLHGGNRAPPPLLRGFQSRE